MARSRIWVWGDKGIGYAVSATGRKKHPWQSEVWFAHRIYRTDLWATKDEALDYARQRKRGHYGGISHKVALKRFQPKKGR